ncbi:uncharacterized protein LOC120203555 [Hibiscus syriacus]|uniref:uncharacterized protein LOC120203555 n=1 Tax=Hibiscus syriacus TaxID=106335 RepID=UPI001924EF84|nr:uncharacterized protein LOC120203555 [Hibiscus syriacus]
MDAFRSSLEGCNFSDLGYSGRLYTWERGKFPSNNIQQRLDRIVANSHWMEAFPDFSVRRLTHTISDHCPLLINLAADFSAPNQAQCFRFNADRVLEEECGEIISSFWANNNHHLPIKLNLLGITLQQWIS